VALFGEDEGRGTADNWRANPDLLSLNEVGGKSMRGLTSSA
jgi:hypothetical protein